MHYRHQAPKFHIEPTLRLDFPFVKAALAQRAAAIFFGWTRLFEFDDVAHGTRARGAGAQYAAGAAMRIARV